MLPIPLFQYMGEGAFFFSQNIKTKMQIYLFVSALIIALSSTIFGISIYSKNKNSKVNRTFAFFCLSVMAWSYAYLFFPLSTNKIAVLRSFQILHIGASFVSVAYFHFVATWLDKIENYKKTLIIGYAIASFFAFSVFSPYFITSIEPKFSMPLWATPGPLYHFYLIFFFGYFIFSSYLLLKNFKDTSGIKRAQTKFILIGMILTFLGGSTNYPLWYNINIPPYGNILASTFVIFSAYAIVKYRLLDIKVMLRKSTVTLASVLSLLLIIVPTNLIIIFLLPNVKFILLTTATATALISIGLYPYFRNYFYKVANKYFFSSLYDEHDLLAKIHQDLKGIVNETKVYECIADNIGNTFHASKIAIAIKNSKGIYKTEYADNFKTPMKKIIKKDSRLINFFKKTSTIFMYSEIAKTNPKKFKDALRRMRKYNLELLIPLKVQDNLIGLIMLGEKYNKDVYSKEDLQVLEIISGQSAITIENARLYSEMKSFNKKLRQKVEEQTKDLQEKNVRLEELLQMRTDFLNTASHQLRTPISIIQGLSSMLEDGSYDKKPERRKEAYGDILEGARAMNRLVDDILQAASCDTDKDFSLDTVLENISIVPYVQKVIQDQRILAKRKNITVNFEYPKDLPNVFSSEKHLRHIVSNLLENAITYTPEKGNIKINLSINKKDKSRHSHNNSDKKMRFQIKDTGIGIPEKELPTIFDKFTRGSNTIPMNANGSGLGLFIIKRLVEAHPKGEIGIESKENIGTTIWFEIPLAS